MSTITTTAEAEQAIESFALLLQKLSGIVEQETALIKAGHVRKATGLTQEKSLLAGELYSSGERIKANAKFIRKVAPARCAALARVQEAFRAILQKNLVVLATAHAVSEGIVRRLSGDLGKKTTPQVYGATGRAAASYARHGQPIAVSRKL
jgi:flagellar biosynthesis/type III secretory pathway chaperone